MHISEKDAARSVRLEVGIGSQAYAVPGVKHKCSKEPKGQDTVIRQS